MDEKEITDRALINSARLVGKKIAEVLILREALQRLMDQYVRDGGERLLPAYVNAAKAMAHTEPEKTS